jgi:hypothetical protein
MSSPSNIYAEKVFSEHPLGLWSLDENAPYLSLTGNYANLSLWSVSGATVNTSQSLISPIEGLDVFQLSGEGFDGTNPGQITLTTPNLFSFSDLDLDFGTITISTYFYAQSPKIDSVFIGYTYSNGTSNIDVLKEFSSISPGAWGLLSETFQIDSDITSSISLKMVITYTEETTPGAEYNFFITAVAAGQYAEDSNSVSVGANSSTILSDILIDETIGVPVNAYGLQNSPGYLIVKDKVLYARNFGMPMVFGTNSATTIYTNNSGPSMVIPGFGFLNKVGQHKDLTFESWIRIDPNTTTPKRIIGPISSLDGLYVDGPFLTLKIGKYSASHFVYEWGRPMLINIRIVKNFASLLINGEQVISLNIVTDDLDLPDQYDDYLSSNKKEQDWIGIYSYDDIPLFQIDAIAIYPYQVSEIIAKRRFIYGQGVDFPNNIRGSATDSVVYIDYPFAQYTNNYAYPDLGKWNQGISENLRVDAKSISSPDYNLPTVYLSPKKSTITNLSATTSEITFQSANSFAAGDIINISNLIVNYSNNTIYNLSNAKVLSATSSQFVISNTTGVVSAYSSGGIATSTIAQTSEELLTDLAAAQTISDSMYFSLKPNTSWNNTSGYLLFNNMNLLYQPVKAFYGVFQADVSSSQEQILFKVENEISRNYFKISLIDDTVKYYINYGNLGEYQICSETVIPGTQFSVGIDIQEFSSLFGNNLSSFFGDPSQLKFYIAGDRLLEKTFSGKIYKVAFLTSSALSRASQYFSSNYTASDADGLMSISDSYTLKIRDSFSNLIFDIEAMSEWEDYVPMRYFAKYVTDATNETYYDVDFIQFNVSYPEPIASGGVYDTESSAVKTYVSFQLAAGVNKKLSELSISPASSTGVVNPGDDWITAAYEVVNGMIIYPPSSISVDNLVLVTHLVMNTKSCTLKPIRINSLEYASESFNDLSPNAIGTRFGSSLYPYTRLGVYLDYKRKNPFTIYKGSTPYLYLTKHSGIQLRGVHGQPASRGLASKINASKAPDYLLNGIQLAMKYSESSFPSSPIELFEIEGADSQIRVYAQSSNSSGTRARIYALDTIAGRLDDSVVFYINGIPTKNPNININDWAMLGLQFTGKLDFSEYAGEFRITGPAMVNNISYYQYDQNRQAQTITFREWLQVLYSDISTLDWDYWKVAPNMQWRGVLYVLSTKTYDIDLSQSFKSYVGTNKIIFSGPATLLVNKYRYSVYKGISWQTKTISPV